MALDHPDIKIKSLAKALTILECFSISKPELSLTEMVELTGIQKGTVYNILCTLSALGYVQQDTSSSLYRLGLGLLRFGNIINNHLRFQTFFLPYIKEIARQLGERSYLGIPYGTDVLYIESCDADGRSAGRFMNGALSPLYCTGVGKAMLAYLPNPRDILPNTMTDFTENTVTDPKILLEELELIRARGYAVDNMEHEYGVRCVAIPVFGVNGDVLAAVSASGPALRLPEEDIPRIAMILKETLAPAQYVL